MGSTGEFSSLPTTSAPTLVESLVDRGRGRIPIIVGTAAEWADEVVRCIKESSGNFSRVRDIAPA